MGRDEDCQELDQLWQQTTDRSAIIDITGMPGVGKTELAIQYGRSRRDDYLGGVVWFSAAEFGVSIRDWMQRQFCPDQDLRRLEKLEQQVALGWDAWQDYCGPQRMALVMIDDVTDYHQQVAPYLPEVESDRSSFRFLLTGRSDLGSQIPTLKLKELGSDAAVTMLARFAGTERIDVDRATAETLCNRLGYLPLAIALVGCWLSIDADRTLTDLIASLERYGLAAPALERDRQTAKLTAERGLQAAFAVSWAQLAEINASAQQLARVLSLFASVDLSWKLVAAVVQWYTQHYAQPQPTVQRRSRSSQRNGLGQVWQQIWQWLCRLVGQHPRPSILLPTPAPIADLVEAKGALLRLNLMQQVDGKEQTYRLHPLLREFFQAQWQGADQEGWEIAFSNVVCDYARSIPGKLSWEHTMAFDWLRPHFTPAGQILQDQMATAPDPETARRYKQRLGDIKVVIFRLSQPAQFETTFARACQLHDQAKQDAAAGRTQQASRKFTAALEDYRKAITQARAAFPADSMQLAGYLHRLAMLFEELGNYQNGIPPAQEAVDIASVRASPLKLASYLHNLARLYRLQGRYSEAEPLFKQALALRQRLLGEDHPDVANSYNSLAVLYYSQERYAEAEPLSKQALELRQRLLGEDHPSVATSYNNLAQLYRSQGRYADAEPLYQQALALSQRLLGKDHPDVATSYNNLAGLYQSQGRYAEAEPLYILALQLFQTRLGSEHPSTNTVFNNLVYLITQAHQANRANELSDHPTTQAILQQIQAQE